MFVVTFTCLVPKYLLTDVLCNILSGKFPNFVGKYGDSLRKNWSEENKKTLVLKIFLLKLQD